MQRVIIIGATSGIGRALAQKYIDANCVVGITGRREYLLKEVQESNESSVKFRCFDISKDNNNLELNSLIQDMGGLDTLIISSGVGYENPNLESKEELETVAINVKAFTEIVDCAFNYFKTQNSGHIIGITSIAALMASDQAPAYNASKAYQSFYLSGLQQKVKKESLNIHITDIRPGFVDTAMAKGNGLFWVAPVEKASDQIYKAIKLKRNKVYITKRWGLIAIALKLLGLFR